MPSVTFKGVKGGDKLKAVLKRIANNKVEARIGFFRGATYPNGTSVAYVAYLNEYGGHNPERPFIGSTEKRNLKKWTKGIANIIKKGGTSRANMIKAFEAAAIVAVGDVKQTIQEWPQWGNKPSTIDAKRKRGRNGKNQVAIVPEQVLIDTGRMISAVSYEVKK